MIKIIGLILCGILFYILVVSDIPILITSLGGMVIGWVSACIIYNWR